ncbi:MAG: metallophosphoesterase [Marinovum sp.]|nr:metallophosphoesterase [Marinovum sp.]
MEYINLGVRNQPVLLFGGSYSNAHATKAMINWATENKIADDHRIMTGDAVAYCAHPNETIDLIRKSGAAMVAGNCEKQLAIDAQDCGCGFEEGSLCNLLSVGWYSFTTSLLRTDLRQWMKTLPDIAVFTHQGLRAAVIHGGVSDIARFLWPNSTQSEFEFEIKLLQEYLGQIDLVIAGHCGFAFTRQIGPVTWINAGTIAMPENRGDPRTRFAVLESKAVRFHYLDYDHFAASQAMRNAGLNQGYDKSLVNGYWPSEEVLPAELRRERAMG